MKFPSWKSWWLQYKVKGLLCSFVSVASFALVRFPGVLVLTHFKVAISFLLVLLCLTFSVCLSLLPAVFHTAQMAEHWIQRHAIPVPGTVWSHPAPLVAERGGVQSHWVWRGEECLWSPEILCADPLSIHMDYMCFSPQNSGSWWLLGSFTNTVKGISLIKKNPTMSQLEVTLLEVLDFHSEKKLWYYLYCVCRKSLLFCSQKQINVFSQSSTSSLLVADTAHGKFHPESFRLANLNWKEQLIMENVKNSHACLSSSSKPLTFSI